MPFILAEISPSDGTLCHGQEMKWTCTGNATLKWRFLKMTAAYDYMGGFNEETPLDVFQAKLLGSVNTTIRSTACIPAGTMSSHLNGESLECIDSETANVTLFIEGMVTGLKASHCLACSQTTPSINLFRKMERKEEVSWGFSLATRVGWPLGDSNTCSWCS